MEQGIRIRGNGDIVHIHEGTDLYNKVMEASTSGEPFMLGRNKYLVLEFAGECPSHISTNNIGLNYWVKRI